MSAPIILEDPAPPPLVLEPDALHFSALKKMGRSPAHVRHALTTMGREPTRPMRIGTIVHHLVCGPHNRKPLVRYGGESRVGNAWKDFQRSVLSERPHAEIVTEAEWRDAEPIALAILADPIAASLIGGSRREVALSWSDAGIACATDGIDGVNDARRAIWDLKISHSSEPSEFSHHATRMAYHAQMAWFERAAEANGIPTDGGVFLIAAEAEAPYVTTVVRCHRKALDAGNRTVTRWLERYRVCLEDGVWPGYVQDVVDYDLPEWEWGEDGGDEDGESPLPVPTREGGTP